MNAEKWQKINELFHAAVELEAEKRLQFIEENSNGDAEVFAEVKKLISAHEEAQSFIENSVDITLKNDFEFAEKSLIGQQFGAYKVVGEIGRGGMGTVYLGERTDGEFVKKAAIKVIKRGMDTEAVLRRFRQERQILASLEHPNIARLLDGGTTADGLPYFAMEYIEGLSITEYVKKKRLVITERLDLFRQVCSAVTFAHQRLIVHRDIKPANIIVTNDGVPKLLDFGIAKLIDEDEKSLTKTGMRLMTPEYASPEQAQGLQITTLSDIYSLGVVLYEMLTGQLPYSFENRSVLEIAKLISTEEPIKPSERTVETRQIEQKDTDKGQKIKRQTLPNSKTLKGDLDNIVLMAMRKEPEKRYASVGQFSEDIRRHLAGLPVIARPLDWKEKFAKFISRNKAATALTAIVFLTLLGGIMATTWQSIRANQQKELAEKRFGEIRKFARTVLFDYHDSIKDLPGSTPVRERLVRDALQYLDALANESNNDASLQLELATAFERVGDVQGGTLLANLGDTAGAIESYRKALNVLQTPPISNLQTNEVLFVKAQCAKKIGALLWETGEMKAALEESEKSRDMFGELVKNNPNEFNYRYEYVSTFDRIGQIQQEQNNLESAKENYAKYLDLLNGFSAEEKASEKVQRQFSIGYEHLGGLYLQNGEFEKALTENTRALEIRRNLAEKNPLNADFQRVYAVSFYNQGEIQRNLSRFAEAQESYQKYLEISQNLLAKDPNNEQYRGDTAYGLIRIGDMQLELGKPEQALLNYQKSQKMRVEDVQKDEANLWKRSSLIESHSKISKAFSKMNQTNSAENEIKQTLDLMDKTEVKPDNALFRSFFAETYFELGEAYSNLKLTKLSCEMYQKSNEILQDMTNRKIMTKADDERFEKISKALRSCE